MSRPASFRRSVPLQFPSRSFLSLALVLVSLLPGPAGPVHAATAPRTAPAFTLPTRTATVESDSLRGRVVVVDFWASWCGPCRKSFPWLAGLQKKYADRGLVVVGVNLDKDRQLAEGFLRDFDVPFTIAFDPAGRSAAAYAVKGMPTTCLVGRDGTLLDSHVGFTADKAAAFERLIEEALAQ
ncbi:MAG: TlpA disulfide reductase family protein [Candidatus Eisenbacteria bacterium]